MEKIDVSVIIPAYNAEMTIEAAIESVIAASTGYEIEILVVNDGSTDGTHTKVEELKGRHSQIVLLRNKRRKGPSGARNTGIDWSCGDYVAFLDADDEWFSHHLLYGLEVLRNTEPVDGVLFNQEIRERFSQLPIGDWFSSRKSFNQLKSNGCTRTFVKCLMEEGFLHVQSLILRRRAIGKTRFREDISRHEDRDFGIQLSLKGVRILVLPEITGIYFRHGDSLSANTLISDIKGLEDKMAVLRPHLSSNIGRSARLGPELLETCLALSYLLRRNGNFQMSGAYWLRSFQYGMSFGQAVELGKVIVQWLTSKARGGNYNQCC